MQSYYRHLGLLGKRLLLLMVFMSLTRFVFYFFNYSLFSTLTASQVIQHFFYGLRFDFSAVFLYNLFFILFSVLPRWLLNKKWYQAFLKVFFISVSSFLLLTNLIDTKFYEFEGKRLTSDIFSKEWLGEDFITLLPEFIKDFWYIFLLFIGVLYLLVLFYPKFKENIAESGNANSKKIKYFIQLTIAFLVLGLSVFIGRGGFQLKPIGIIAAARYTSPEFMALILNSPFTIIKTFGDKGLPKADYFQIEELEDIYNPVLKFDGKTGFKKKNVVILILESFSKEYSGYLNDTVGFTPHLDSIMQLGFTCTNAFANGKRSIEALPSIFSGLPALMDNAIVNTKFSSNAIEGIGSILNNEGYYTAFFHGGKNGTMGFDNYVKLVGIQHYFGIDEYPNKVDYDGNWGIFDEPYLEYFVNEMSAMPQPFFTSVFTLSSHHPYKVPEKYVEKFPKGDLVNLESIGYTDYALGEFFKKAAGKPWFKNTLFIITADHTAQANSAYYKSNIGKYAVPIVYYAPGDSKLVGTTDKVTQQADILPSVLDYLSYKKPFVAFGSSVFSPDTNSFAINYLSGIYQLKTQNALIAFDGTNIISREQMIGDSLVMNPNTLPDSLQNDFNDKLLKAIIQQYNYRMEHNLLKFHGKLEEYSHD